MKRIPQHLVVLCVIVGVTAGARGLILRVMIVALARTLLIALWRFSETGLVPSGAKLV